MSALRLTTYLRDDLVFFDLPRLGKAEFLDDLATRVAARVPDIESAQLCDLLRAREAEQSTGIGHGLALPHALIPGLRETLIAVARPESKIEFAALDGRPVDLFFLVLSSAEDTRLHVRVLARLSRIIDHESALERLRAAADAPDLYRVLLAEDARHA